MADRLTRRRWKSLAAIALFSMLCGCGANGDFGRMRSSLTREDTHAWLGPAAIGPEASSQSDALGWRHQLTDEEKMLRNLAYPLIEPPYDRNRWYSALAEYGVTSQWPMPERGAYASRLFQTAYRSQTARYNKLMDDIGNDMGRLDSFFSVAHYVSDMDAKREKSMAYVSSLSEEERINTVTRIRENKAVVGWVRASLRERAASFRFALERLVIAAPSPSAVEAERGLTLLSQRIDAYGG